MKKIIMILLVVATMSMAEEGVRTTDTNNTTIETTAVEKPVEQERGLLGSVSYGAGAVLGGITYVGVAIITSPLHLFNLNK